MEKVIRDGKVAVLYSPGYGAGWYTWNTGSKWLLHHPDIVAAVESGDNAAEVAERIAAELGEDIYPGGADQLKIEWLPVGTTFEITEYDGSEGVRVIGSLDDFLVA